MKPLHASYSMLFKEILNSLKPSRDHGNW